MLQDKNDEHWTPPEPMITTIQTDKESSSEDSDRPNYKIDGGEIVEAS